MKKKNKLASGMALGIVFRTVVGVLTKNIGLWLAVGIAIGAGVGNSQRHKAEKKNEDEAN